MQQRHIRRQGGRGRGGLQRRALCEAADRRPQVEASCPGGGRRRYLRGLLLRALAHPDGVALGAGVLLPAERGLPLPQRLGEQQQRLQKKARHGVLPWRLLRLGLDGGSDVRRAESRKQTRRHHPRDRGIQRGTLRVHRSLFGPGRR